MGRWELPRSQVNTTVYTGTLRASSTSLADKSVRNDYYVLMIMPNRVSTVIPRRGSSLLYWQ